MKLALAVARAAFFDILLLVGVGLVLRALFLVWYPVGVLGVGFTLMAIALLFRRPRRER